RGGRRFERQSHDRGPGRCSDRVPARVAARREGRGRARRPRVDGEDQAVTSVYDHIPDFGLLYDSVPLYQERKDVDFYVAEAKAAKGGVLEVGCGTGRILLPIARAGSPIVGIDSSRQMLARCRAKLATESAAVRKRARVEDHEMRDFDLGTRFSLIVAPFRVLQHLTTI